jgi:hypothetical protein
VHVSCYEKEATHREKRTTVQHLISEFQEKKRCRFLRFCSKNKSWVQAPLKQIKIKIGHGLRDARLQLADESNFHGQKSPRKSSRLSTSEDRSLFVPTTTPPMPSQTHGMLVPEIDVVAHATKHCHQRQEFGNTTQHNGSERPSLSRMCIIENTAMLLESPSTTSTFEGSTISAMSFHSGADTSFLDWFN